MSINSFTVFGERCSGTNYLQTLMKKNFVIRERWDWGWKHFFGFKPFVNSSNTLFLGIVRDYHTWIPSLQLKQHHLSDRLRQSWKSFLTHEWESREKGKEILADRNLHHHRQRYRNLFHLRAVKLHYLRKHMPQKVNHYALVRMEDLQRYPFRILAQLQQIFKLRRRSRKWVNETSYKGLERSTFIRKTYDVPKEAQVLIQERIRVSMEKKFGYNRKKLYLKPKLQLYSRRHI